MELPGFADLGLDESILKAIADAGYTTPTAIQAGAIPEVLAGRDVIGIAQTGTGKTASFVLPMLHVLANGRARARMPRSLIISPTRELATQTAQNFEIYGKHLNLTMALLIGGVGMGDQEKALERGVDVLIATPGRLLDWFERGKVLLGGVNILVVDEADRMLDMGFMPDVERILTLLTGRRQTLLFSATMPPGVRRIIERFLNDPARIEVSRPATTVDAVDAVVVAVPGGDLKRRALVRLIAQQSVEKAIIFANRKREVSSLNRFLQGVGLNARDIHGDLEQAHRQATLDAFKADEVDFLVATDVAARGLDISDMPVVINYDVPFNADDYVHRIGRTGRAGKSGRAFTLTTTAEAKSVAAIERLIGKPIRMLDVPGVEPEAAVE
ncbi:MAG: DEAD/DEAH box helicase, partial [Geminicoccaceae bacterium]